MPNEKKHLYNGIFCGEGREVILKKRTRIEFKKEGNWTTQQCYWMKMICKGYELVIVLSWEELCDVVLIVSNQYLMVTYKSPQMSHPVLKQYSMLYNN